MARNRLIRELTAAIVADDLEAVGSLVARGADVNGRSERGASPLWNAIWYGRRKIFDVLLDAGAKPNDRVGGYRYLHKIAGQKRVSAWFVTRLIAAGADVNSVQDDVTPYARAITAGNTRALEAMLAAPALDVRATHFARALELARSSAQAASVTLLEHRRTGGSVPAVALKSPVRARGAAPTKKASARSTAAGAATRHRPPAKPRPAPRNRRRADIADATDARRRRAR